MNNQDNDFDTFMSAISHIEVIHQSGALDTQMSQTSQTNQKPSQSSQEQAENCNQRVLRSRTVLKSRSLNNESMNCINDIDNKNTNSKNQRKRKNVSRNNSIVDKENSTVSYRTQPKRFKKARLTKLSSLETEVASILANDLSKQQIHIEVPRRSDMERINEHNFSVNELDQNISPIVLKKVDEKMDVTSYNILDSDPRSAEISLRVYDNNENTTNNFQNHNELNFLKIRPESITSMPCGDILKKNPFDISLNLSCHSDTSYDLAEHSPFRDLEEELDENNNLVMSHPKLSSFVVTSDLNSKFSQNIYNDSSRAVLQDLNTLNETGLMNFERVLSSNSITSYKDNYNWKLFKNILVDNSNTLSSIEGIRAADISMENFTSPLLVIEQEAQALQEAEEKVRKAADQIKKTNNASNEDSVKQEVKFIKKILRSSMGPETEDLKFAFDKCQEIFTEEELSTGIFCEYNKKGKVINRSKVRTALCEEKVYQLKEELSKRLGKSGCFFEDAWHFLRTDLNKILYSQFRSKIKREKN